MPDRLATALAEVVGDGHVLSDPDVVAGYTVDWTRRWRGPAALVVRPRSTAEVAKVLRVCRAHRVPVIPQGATPGWWAAASRPSVGWAAASRCC